MPADCAGHIVVTLRFVGKRHKDWFAGAKEHFHNLSLSDFDNLNHIEIADEIQRQESKRAREWAGDE